MFKRAMLKGFYAGGALISLTLVAMSDVRANTIPAFQSDSGQPAIAAPGSPDFWALNYSASLTKSGSTYTLSISGTDPNVGVFNVQNAAYLVGNESVQLTAHFDSTGHLLTNQSNTLEIDGSLSPWNSPTFGSPPAGYSWSAQPAEKLFSATLTSVGVDSQDQALGFSISNFSGWADQSQFTSGGTESLWLYSLVATTSAGDQNGQGQGNQGQGNGNGQGNSAHTAGGSWARFLAEIEGHGHLHAASFEGISSVATVPLPAAVLLLGSGLAGLGLIRRRREPSNG
jgi:hypothetical protein